MNSLPHRQRRPRTLSAFCHRSLTRLTVSLVSLAIGLAAGVSVAEDYALTPAMAEGPFYPSQLPSDTDNDLLIVNDQLTPGVGEITHLTGRVLDAQGNPVRNAVVEIWQVDHHGVYLHPNSLNREHRDRFFQGFGRFLTGPSGDYYFRTIRPTPYPGRAPHIHFAIKRPGQETFTTQCFIKGHPGNPQDRLWQEIRDPEQREAVTVDFVPLRGSPIEELTARFDIVLDTRPQDSGFGVDRVPRWLSR